MQQGDRAAQAVGILLVDDHEENLIALEAILSDLPDVAHRVPATELRFVRASSGPAALRAVLREDFALILLDVAMPGMDGFEVASLIKKRERSKHIPIIFLTAESRNLESALQGYEVGAVDYLHKPLEAAVVRAKVAVFVELHRRGDEIRRQSELLQEAEQRRREAEIAEVRRGEQHRYRNLADAMPQIVFAARSDGEVTQLNQRWTEYTGLARETSLGFPLPRVLHPSDTERFIEQWRRAREAEEPLRAECRLRGAQGGYRFYLCETLPERDDAGTIVGWLGTFTDVDEQRRISEERTMLLASEQAARAQAELALRRTEFLADASRLLSRGLDPAGILGSLAELAVARFSSWCVIDLLDAHGETAQASFHHEDAALLPLGEALAQRLPRPSSGRSPEEADGEGALDAMEPELWASEGCPARLAAALGVIDTAILSRLGATSYLAVPLRAREQMLGVLTLVLAREDRLYGAGDLALAVDLGQRVALAIDNARLYETSQEAVRIREEFLSIASHELRTPLSALQLQVQSIQLQLRRTPIEPERLLGKVSVAQRQVERLTRLINELLDVSRIQAGRLELDREDTDLSELVRDVVSRFGSEIERSGSRIELTLADGVIGQWDRLRLDQVTTNLLHNAIKYGRSRPIHVTVEVQGDRARLTITDEGIGIPEEDLRRIFGRFERAVSSRAYGGMGVGLFIVDQILRAHGGLITVHSEPNVGSSFLVDLPLAPELRTASSPPRARDEGAPAPTA